MDIVGFLNVLVALFTGPMARLLAILAGAYVGYQWMWGSHNVGEKTLNFIIGCFFVFGIGSIVGLFI